MTDRSKLERSYRRLLACYPAVFRKETGEELLQVLLARATANQRRPGLADTLDLIVSGLRMRLRPQVPRAPQSIRAAVRLMYAGAIITSLEVAYAIVSVISHQPGSAKLLLLGHSQSTFVAVTAGVVFGLVVVGLWLWMARANGNGQRRARVISTVLFGLATLELSGNKSVAEAVIAAATWFVGLAVVWLLWRPASSGFYERREDGEPSRSRAHTSSAS
jgi:hypothetical protein